MKGYLASRKNAIATTVVRAKRTREEVSSGHQRTKTYTRRTSEYHQRMNYPSALGVRRISMVVWV